MTVAEIGKFLRRRVEVCVVIERVEPEKVV